MRLQGVGSTARQLWCIMPDWSIKQLYEAPWLTTPSNIQALFVLFLVYDPSDYVVFSSEPFLPATKLIKLLSPKTLQVASKVIGVLRKQSKCTGSLMASKGIHTCAQKNPNLCMFIRRSSWRLHYMSFVPDTLSHFSSAKFLFSLVISHKNTILTVSASVNQITKISTETSKYYRFYGIGKQHQIWQKIAQFQ